MNLEFAMNTAIGKSFLRLVDIMHQLRKECPWDRQQTAESLRKYILEEAYEAVDTIDTKDWIRLRDELGDLMLQIVFQSEIAEENGYFSILSVLESINNKLVSRHPHVFGDKKVNTADDVEHNWEKIKIEKEKRKSLLSGIPDLAPALLRAQRLQEKASRVSFDWKKTSDVVTHLESELEELKIAIEHKNQEDIEEEMGDFLFTIVNLARFLEVSAEDALRQSNRKFIKRFGYIEASFNGDFEKMRNAGIKTLDRLWDEAKKKHG
jgi:MazG family protein